MSNTKTFPMALLGTTTLAALSFPTLAYADDIVDQIQITVPVSCSVEGTGMTSHTAEINNGTYVANIGTTTMHAFCNDSNGFAIYATGYTGNEIGTTNSNKLVGTAASNNETIVTGTATAAGNPDVSNWAMKLAITQDSGDTSGSNAFAIDNSFNAYHAVPNSYTKVAHKNSGTDMAAVTGGVKLTTTYAAYISKTQPADTYSGQVIYTLVHPASAEAPIVCRPSGTTISTINCMQDITSANKSTIMASMTTGDQYTLIDKRDSKSYTVAKLADGNVWMTQNLDLDLDAGTTYTNLDTDLGWNGASYDTASWTPVRSTYATSTNNNHGWCNGGTMDSGGWCEQNNTPESYDPGDLYWNGETSNGADWANYYYSCTYSIEGSSCNESLNPLSTYVPVSGSPTPQYHLGNYYNWAAAIASNDASVYGANNENLEANQSICPTGWRLPYISSSEEGDFVDLWTAYGWTDNGGFSDISALWSSPVFLTLGGNSEGYLGGVGSTGFFWYSVAFYDYSAKHIDFSASGNADIVHGIAGNRSYGYQIRCLLR